MSDSVAPQAFPKDRRRWRWLQFTTLSMLVTMLAIGIFLRWAGPRIRAYLGENKMIVPTDSDVATGRNIKWQAGLGTSSYPSPVVAQDKIFVGTNNAGRLGRYSSKVDL